MLAYIGIDYNIHLDLERNMNYRCQRESITLGKVLGVREMVKPPQRKERKTQFGLTLVEWDIRLIKAIAGMSGRSQMEVARQAMLPELLKLAGGSVQSANELITEWESSQSEPIDEDDEDDEGDGAEA